MTPAACAPQPGPCWMQDSSPGPPACPRLASPWARLDSPFPLLTWKEPPRLPVLLLVHSEGWREPPVAGDTHAWELKSSLVDFTRWSALAPLWVASRRVEGAQVNTGRETQHGEPSSLCYSGLT